MRWKDHKKTQQLLWVSFLCVLFLAMFLAVLVGYAQPQIAANNPIVPLTDQQLIALLNKSDNSKVSRLPPKINGKDIYLNPSSTQIDASSTQTSDSHSAERCLYNNQNYVLGDMINTAQGWLRCTPTVTFSSDQPITYQQGPSAWMKVQ
jgi:hypothetical protein